MITSEFDNTQANPQDFIDPANVDGLPDIAQLTQLANSLFTALPCDGSRLGALAGAVPEQVSSPLPGLHQAGFIGLSPQNPAEPDPAAIKQFFSSRTSSSYGSVPNHLDTSPVYGGQQARPSPSLDTSGLAANFPQDLGLPSEAQLQELLVGRPPNTVAANGLTDNAPGLTNTYASLTPQVFASGLQKLFACQPPASATPVSPAVAANPWTDAVRLAPEFDASLIAGLSPEVYGLPGEAELQKLFAPASHPQATAAASNPAFYFLDESRGDGVNPAAGLGLAHPPFDVHALRRDFPILKERVNGYPLAWLDNAATTQKPQAVIDRVSYFYEHENSNIHRAAHELAARATDAYEHARDTVAKFLNASSAEEIIFVRGTTEGINLVAQSWGRGTLLAGDEIVVTWLEHHANIVPWQQLCAATGAVLRVAPVDDSGQVLLGEYQKLLNSRTKLVAFTHVSNALGTITPAQEIIAMAHRVGAKVLLDAAQSIAHLQVDVQALDCDWCVFSGHKIFGPTGIGAVYGKPELLEAMPPWQGGGNMIADVTFEKTLYQPAPAKFEAGTGNIADAVGLGAALDYLSKISLPNVARYEHELLLYGMEALQSIKGLRLIGTAKEKTSVLSFVLAGHSNQDIGVALNRVGIAVRTGHHCAQPILRRFGQESTVRPSLAFYNTYEEIDRLVSTVRDIQAGKIA
ncbi:MAG: family 2A encapsulin nanocompartment cargo protein cysteine desulfurase [Methylococcales bacterium]|nr:family 2A encapsulin nanocompartment cargo protein cysteine desulfurase [Methylococcales bacterium]